MQKPRSSRKSQYDLKMLVSDKYRQQKLLKHGILQMEDLEAERIASVIRKCYFAIYFSEEECAKREESERETNERYMICMAKYEARQQARQARINQDRVEAYEERQQAQREQARRDQEQAQNQDQGIIV